MINSQIKCKPSYKITIFEAPKVVQAQWEKCHLLVGRCKYRLETLKSSNL